MEKQHHDHKGVPDAASPETRPICWVAPLQSIAVFSAAEFTQNFSSPGNDGLGTFTGS